MSDIWAPLGEINRGVFTRAQALDCGSTDRELLCAVRERQLVRLRHGCYCRWEDYELADDLGRHLLLARAVVTSQRGVVALTGPSAAALHGLVLHEQDLATVHLVRLDAGSARGEVGAKHHVLRHDITADLELKEGLLAVNVARAVWEVSTMSSLESAVCTADSALRLYPQIAEQVHQMAPTFARRPGSRRARLALMLADGRSESAGESLSRMLCWRFGIPAPKLQFEVLNRDGRLLATCDFGWPEFRHVGEFDGKAKYDRFLKPGEAPGDAVFREKRREDEVRAEAFGMTRWIWRDLFGARRVQVARALEAELETSRALYSRGRVA